MIGPNPFFKLTEIVVGAEILVFQKAFPKKKKRGGKENKNLILCYKLSTHWNRLVPNLALTSCKVIDYIILWSLLHQFQLQRIGRTRAQMVDINSMEKIPYNALLRRTHRGACLLLLFNIQFTYLLLTDSGSHWGFVLAAGKLKRENRNE